MIPLILGQIANETRGAVGALREVDNELDSVREKLIAGSAASRQFESSISDSAREESAQIKRFTQIATLAAKTAALNAGAGLARMAGMKTERMTITQKELLDIEDDIAETLVSQKFTQNELLIMSEKQMKLEEARIRFFSQAATEDRTRVNAAKEALGEMIRARELLNIQIKEEKEIARVDLLVVAEKIKGRGRIAEMMKSEIEWQHQINAAYREGKDELAKTLTAQRDLDLAQQAASQKRQTTRERIAERRDARVLKSDADKQAARNAELDRAILRGARGGAGSRLEERRRQNIARNQMLLNPKEAPVQPPELVMLTKIATLNERIAANTKGSLIIKA